ncbi:tetratricopeptide repeat protein [Ferruginibacter sp.]
MKQLLFSLSALFFITACNNAAKEEPVTQLQVPEQEKALKDAVTQYPDSIPLRKALIKYYEELQSSQLAMKEVDNAIKVDSNDVELWDKKATIFLYDEDTLNAIRSYNKAIEVYPDPQYIMSVGVLYAFKRNDTALAMADALLMAKKSNADKEALLIKGIYFGAINEKQKALGFFDNCLKLDYTYMSAYLQKGITLFELGKYQESIAIFDRATTLQNSFAEGYYWMGRNYEQLKDNNNAIENYRKALFYDPDYVEVKEAMGRLGVK